MYVAMVAFAPASCLLDLRARRQLRSAHGSSRLSGHAASPPPAAPAPALPSAVVAGPRGSASWG